MKLKRIIQMLSEGKSFNAICKDTHSSKTTVSIYKKLVDDTKLPYVELLEKSDSELEKLRFSKLSKPAEDVRKAPLQEMMPEIIKRLGKRYANIQLVYEEFYLKQEGGALWLHPVQEPCAVICGSPQLLLSQHLHSR